MTQEQYNDVVRPRYGQVTRRTGGVCLIWDLQQKRGISLHLEKYLEIGTIVRFRIANDAFSLVQAYVHEKDLPQGLHPLIAVPTDGHPPPTLPPNDQAMKSVQIQKARKIAKK